MFLLKIFTMPQDQSFRLGWCLNMGVNYSKYFDKLFDTVPVLCHCVVNER